MAKKKNNGGVQSLDEYRWPSWAEEELDFPDYAAYLKAHSQD